MHNSPLEYVPQFGRKFVGKTWLHEETGTAFLLGTLAHRRCGVAGDYHNWNVSRSRVALQLLNQLPSVTVSQRELRDDDVGVKFPSPAASLLTISSRDCLETKQGKTLDVQVTRVVVILDDEYQRSGRPVPRTAAIHWFEIPLKTQNIVSQGTDLSRF
jgi:hypothetical protein